jgi:hypothetical protein
MCSVCSGDLSISCGFLGCHREDPFLTEDALDEEAEDAVDKVMVGRWKIVIPAPMHQSRSFLASHDEYCMCSDLGFRKK